MEQGQTRSPDPDPSSCNRKVPKEVSHQPRQPCKDYQKNTKYEQIMPTGVSIDLNQSHFLNPFFSQLAHQSPGQPTNPVN